MAVVGELEVRASRTITRQEQLFWFDV